MPYIEDSIQTARARYSFAADGGAVGTIALRGDRIPQGAIVIDALLDVTTALAGGTGADTVALGLEGTTDLQAAAARNGAPWSTTGAKRMTFTGTSPPIRTTQTRPVQLTIAGSALTAGALDVYVRYLEPAL